MVHDPLNIGVLQQLRCVTLMIEQDRGGDVNYVPWVVSVLGKVAPSSALEEIRIACTLVDDLTFSDMDIHGWGQLDSLLVSDQFRGLRNVWVSFHLMGKVSIEPQYIFLSL